MRSGHVEQPQVDHAELADVLNLRSRGDLLLRILVHLMANYCAGSLGVPFNALAGTEVACAAFIAATGGLRAEADGVMRSQTPTRKRVSGSGRTEWADVSGSVARRSGLARRTSCCT
jgi:hypothetical protein